MILSYRQILAVRETQMGRLVLHLCSWTYGNQFIFFSGLYNDTSSNKDAETLNSSIDMYSDCWIKMQF